MNELVYKLIDLCSTKKGIEICLNFAEDCAAHALQGEIEYPYDRDLISSLKEIQKSCAQLFLEAGFSLYCSEYAAAYVEKTRGTGQAEREWQRSHLLELMGRAT